MGSVSNGARSVERCRKAGRGSHAVCALGSVSPGHLRLHRALPSDAGWIHRGRGVPNKTWFDTEKHTERTLAFERDNGLVNVVVDEPQGVSNTIPSVWEITN